MFMEVVVPLLPLVELTVRSLPSSDTPSTLDPPVPVGAASDHTGMESGGGGGTGPVADVESSSFDNNGRVS